MFGYCSSLTSIDVTKFNIEKVIYMGEHLDIYLIIKNKFYINYNLFFII